MQGKEERQENGEGDVIELVTVPTLYERYRDVITKGLTRTKLSRDKLYSFFPPHLQPAFSLSLKSKGAAFNTPTNMKVVEYLEDIFGILPDYDAPIDEKHAEGFFINGKMRQIFMDKAKAGLGIQRALKGLSPDDVVKKAVIDLKGQFSESEIIHAVKFSLPNGVDRHFVSKIVQIANHLK